MILQEERGVLIFSVTHDWEDEKFFSYNPNKKAELYLGSPQLYMQTTLANDFMKVINIHRRIIPQPVSKIGELLNTLASDHDMILATDKWPRMKLDRGFQIGSKGGHGPIRYFVTDYQPKKSITFQFDMIGFDGFHKFELTALDVDKTELSHIIDMTTTGMATIQWALAIRWLHNAYIEDAFDKVDNYFTGEGRRSEWSFWVKILRKVMKPKRK